jgi:exopolyphosphatase/guanosine-5'-triphosphate,3'-diphosphate pyrophosphatase
MESVYMGCVGMTHAFFEGGRISKRRWRRAELAAAQELEPMTAPFRALGWDQAVGSSGTIRAIRDIAVAAGWSSAPITRPALRRLRNAMLKAGHVDALSLRGLSDERRPVIVGGTVILSSVFDALEIGEMTVSTGALREGLLFDLVGRMRHEDRRERTVRWLAGRYHADLAQSARVGKTAVTAFGQVKEAWSLSERDADLLRWAAGLHEIGLDIAHSHYHRHGAYVIENADLFGFTRSEQQRLALLVRAHRRRFPASLFESQPKLWRQTLVRLAVILRLAVLLRRSRSEVEPDFSLTAGPSSLAVRFPPGWLEASPLTQADLEQEARRLGAAAFALEFE